MLNKAMQIMETLKRAEDARAVLVNEHLEALSVLGYESVKEQTRVVINKGYIKEVQTIKEVQVTNEEELNRVYEENARHIRRINELAAENEKLIDENIELEGQIAFKDGQIISLERTIAELETKIAELTNDKLENIVKKHAEGGDAVEQPKVTPVVETKDKVAEEHAKYATRKPNPKKEPVIIDERKRNGFAEGRISLDNKTYLEFTASNRFDKVVVYGVTDDEQLAKAKELIINQGYGDIFTGYASTIDEVLYTEDKANNAVMFCEDGLCRGFVKNRYFAVNLVKKQPSFCLISDMRKKNSLKPMNNRWGQSLKDMANVFMALRKTIKYVEFNRLIKEEEMGVCSTSSSVTNETVVDTKDVVSNTNDVVPMTDDEAEDLL